MIDNSFKLYLLDEKILQFIPSWLMEIVEDLAEKISNNAFLELEAAITNAIHEKKELQNIHSPFLTYILNSLQYKLRNYIFSSDTEYFLREKILNVLSAALLLYETKKDLEEFKYPTSPQILSATYVIRQEAIEKLGGKHYLSRAAAVLHATTLSYMPKANNYWAGYASVIAPSYAIEYHIRLEESTNEEEQYELYSKELLKLIKTI